MVIAPTHVQPMSFVCKFHGHMCQQFRDVSTWTGDKLAERYEQTMSHLEQITRGESLYKGQRGCEFDDARRTEKLAYLWCNRVRCVPVMPCKGVEPRP